MLLMQERSVLEKAVETAACGYDADNQELGYDAPCACKVRFPPVPALVISVLLSAPSATSAVK
jgi:hypothetical protein